MKNKSFKLDRTMKENKSLRIFLEVFLILLIISGGIMFIYFGFAQKGRNSVIFNEKGNATYQVYLKDNDYYSTPYLEEGMSYIASLIDYINLDFNYNLNSSRESSLEYKYRIDAELIITERGYENRVLFKKNMVLKDDSTITANTNGILNESFKIKYDDYNAMVNNYKKDYALSVSSKLVVKMHIESIGKADNFENDKYVSANDLIVSIPLSEQTLEINFNHNTINNSKEIVEYSSFNPINYIYLFLGFALVIASLIFIIKIILKKNKVNKVSKYTKVKNDILREYDRFIVEADKVKNSNVNKNLVSVKSFNELLDARDNTDNPVIFHEDKLKNESTFMVIDEDVVYVYKISENDFNEK